jgi:hypothetical protein
LDLKTFVQNSQIWTGKEGATSIETLINNVDLQDSIQQQIMSDRFLQLQDAGLITGQEPPEQLAAFVQTATRKGVGVTKQWIESFSSLGNITNSIGDIDGTIGRIPGITGDIEGTLGGLDIFNDLGGTIGDITGGLEGTIADITGGLGDALGDIDLSDNLNDAVGEISGNLEGTISGITQSVGDIAGDLGGSLASLGDGFTSSLDSGISGITEEVGGEISDLAGQLDDINIAAAGANFAVNFAVQKIPALGSFFGGGGGGTGTRSPLIDVNTSDLPEAFSQASEKIIANAKVPPFTTPDDGVPDQLG